MIINNLKQKLIQQFSQQFDSNGQRIYASFFIRSCAALIDMAITAPLIWALLYLIGFDFSNMPTMEQILAGTKTEPTKMNKIADFISWVISISYSVYFVTSHKQATPGKRLMNIYVGTADGAKLSTNLAFARFLCSILSGLLFGAGFLMAAFTKEKTALHDIICKTRVFYGKK